MGEEVVNKEICQVIHANLNARLDISDKRLDVYSNKIAELTIAITKLTSIMETNISNSNNGFFHTPLGQKVATGGLIIAALLVGKFIGMDANSIIGLLK